MLLTASYVLHVGAATFWLGATLYAQYAVVPAATAGRLGPAAFVGQMDRLLGVTRWTGLVLPLTGGYQLWRLYSLESLLGTREGWLVLAMLGLWGGMNTAVELGVLAMRRESGSGSVGLGQYLTEGFPATALDDSATLDGMVAAGRPYLFVATGLALLLVADAALLAGPLPN